MPFNDLPGLGVIFAINEFQPKGAKRSYEYGS